jgi:hypothetical protein
VARIEVQEDRVSALTTSDVAKLLKVHPETLTGNLRTLYGRGFPKPQLVGKRRRWSADAVERWLAGETGIGSASQAEIRKAISDL